MYRLYRSRDDRMLAGVAGGLADLWGADPSLVRVTWALLVVFTGGVALIVYIVMALVVPDEPLMPTTGATQAFSGAPPPVAGEGWVPPADAQAARQAARRAEARRAAGGNRSSFPAAAVLGSFLIILGGFFLAREFLPEIDFDWFWPLVLVGLGALLVVSAIRRPNEPG